MLGLAELARGYDIGLNIDAEEADRLEISLDLLEALCAAPSLAGWNGIGFVIQAYQKRCPFVIDHVIDLARRTGHRLMVRLVKGAYWDSEIKRAQVDGLEDYPVYTRKVHTDVSYIACARRLLAAPDAVYPQFATHNAHTLAAIHELAGPERYTPGQYEFQCLHGMGEPLYEQVVGAAGLDRPCRVYAPVGTHETLLAYLVRRLLENGANTSFVNRVADATLPLETLVADPVAAVDAEPMPGEVNPRIPLPPALYGPARRNSAGLDLASEAVLAQLSDALQRHAYQDWEAVPLLAGPVQAGPRLPVRNPAWHADVVGTVQEASAGDVDQALGWAQAAASAWAATPPAERAAALRRAADALEQRTPALLSLLVREAGKTCANAVAEVREAVDFLRFYAAQVETLFGTETGKDAWAPLGPVVCISPWNFPLAIFMGQVAAALAAGNVVLAKPAEQTPLVAAEAVRILHGAGVPRAAVQLLPGQGETVGARLVGDGRVMGVLFTGSTDVARILQRSVAGRLDATGRPVPLIAETGGQNAMIVDSSALAEQVVADAVASAFDSAGQRCSALRVLCLQGGRGGPRAGDAARRHGGTAHRAARPARHGRGPRDRRRSARRHPAPRGGPARAWPRGAPGARAAACRGRGHLRAAHADRIEGPVGAGARGLRPGPARGALSAQRAGHAAGPHRGHRLRPHPGPAHAHRRNGGTRAAPCPRGQSLREPQHGGRGRRRAALRRRGPVGHGAEGRRSAVPAATGGTGTRRRCAGSHRRDGRPGHR